LAVSGTTVYAGGGFTTVGGQARNGLAALDATTGAATAWNPNANETVWALAVSGTTVYAGGGFTTIGGQPRNYLAALNTSDGLATDWNPDADNLVLSLAVSGTTVYAGGFFTSIGGQARNSLAALDATTDTNNATAWNPDADNFVFTLAVSGTTVYAGGGFTTVAGEARSGLAAIDGAGTLTAWNPDANGIVWALAVSGTTVYAGGGFTTVGGQARNYLAALNTSDGLATAWNPSAADEVRTLAVSGTTIYAGGGFTTIDGTVNGAASQFFAALPAVPLPGAPTGVAAVRANASANVSWTAPVDVGSGITGYRLESAPGPGYDTWTVRIADTESTDPSATVTGLANGTAYRVRVTALATDGAGGTSLASQWFIPIAPTATPAVPTGLDGTPGDGTITATWNAVTEVGVGATHIIRYRTFALAGTTAVRVCNTTGTQATPPATTCELTSLTNGQSFTLVTRSFNNNRKFSDLTDPVGPYTPFNG
jgi:hypothetical protein